METAELPETDGGGEVAAAAAAHPNTDGEPRSPTADSDDDESSGGRFRSDPASPGGAVCDDGGGVAVREEREAVASEEAREGLRRNESVASSVSDTLSSAESVCESEAHRRTEQGGDLERRAALWRDGDPPRPLPPSDAHREPSADLRRFPDEEDQPDLEEDLQVPGEPPEPPLLLTGEEPLSDVSSESRPDPAPDDADEGLRVEIAAASSDSETDEKWRAIFSSSINKEDDDSYLDGLHLSARELFVHKVEAADSEDDDDDDDDDGGDARASVPEASSLAPTVRAASKISEEEDQPERAQRHDPGARDPDRRLPKDFCVIQETTSENVSTEHVDFQSARKQWRAMEEQSNNKAPLLPPPPPASGRRPDPGAGRTRTYAPVRNMERADGRAREAEPSAPQFSPCSEDSGLDDSTPRSPNDELETPPERETGPSAGVPCGAPPSLVITLPPGREPPREEPTVLVVEPGAPEELIILETSNLIVRSASEFSLDRACQPQEKMFPSNPFFKLRSRSSVSLVDEEIRVVRRREEELRKERARLYGHGRLPDKMATLSLDRPASSPMKCKSSPSSPMKTAKMDRSTLSCDHRFPEGCAAGRRKSAMALRWEAGHFNKND